MIDVETEEKLFKKFGGKFVFWLQNYQTSANFFVMWSALGGNQDGQWAALLSMGKAFAAIVEHTEETSRGGE